MKSSSSDPADRVYRANASALASGLSPATVRAKNEEMLDRLEVKHGPEVVKAAGMHSRHRAAVEAAALRN